MSDLLSVILGGETKYIEFKEKYSKSILKTVSAFSNYHDGKVIIGVTDSGQVVGVDDSKEMRLSIENTINDSIKPRPDFEVEIRVVENREILVFSIFKGTQSPYTLDRKAYKRSDTSTVSVDKFEYDELVLLGRNLTYEELEYGSSDLEFHNLGRLLSEKLNVGEINEDILKSLTLIRKEKYTNAAAILADRNNFSDLGFDLVRYADDSMLIFKDRVCLKSISVIEHYETAMMFYRKHINQGDIIKGAYRESYDEVPEEAFREAVANAIIHRDYSRRGNNRIEIFNDRVEITSIGGLPIGISEEEYKNGSFSNARNPIIADIFLRCRIIEKMGTGIRRIKFAYKSFGVEPLFKVYQNSIQIVLPRMSIEQQSASLTMVDVHLSLEEEKLVNYIKGSDGITRGDVESFLGVKKTKATKLLNTLVDKKVILKQGSGKNILYKIR